MNISTMCIDYMEMHARGKLLSSEFNKASTRSNYRLVSVYDQNITKICMDIVERK